MASHQFPVAVALAIAAWISLPSDTQAQRSGLGLEPVTLVARLRNVGAITSVLQVQIEAVSAILITAAREWPRMNVNGVYDPDALNLYLIDVDRAAPPPTNLGWLRGTLRAFPQQRLILADAGYLAQVKAASDLAWASVGRSERLVTHYDALAVAQVEGPDAAVRSRLGSGADWRRGTNNLFDGAVAFLVAHEMGHIVAGLDPTLEGAFSMPRGLQGRDRDRFWACSNLVGERVAGERRQEAEADQYAADLLGQIPYPSAQIRALRFELGALFLLNAELGKTTITVMALNPNAPALMARAGVNLNQDLIRNLAATLGRDTGFIETVFPLSHPSRVDRLLQVHDTFARNPASSFYGQTQSDPTSQMWALLIQMMCVSIAPQR
jgi:hypothetical protein